MFNPDVTTVDICTTNNNYMDPSINMFNYFIEIQNKGSACFKLIYRKSNITLIRLVWMKKWSRNVLYLESRLLDCLYCVITTSGERKAYVYL